MMAGTYFQHIIVDDVPGIHLAELWESRSYYEYMNNKEFLDLLASKLFKLILSFEGLRHLSE